MGKVYTTESIGETKKLASQFARSILVRKNSLGNFRQGVSLQGCKVVALYGDLGSGKTTFVQGMAKGLGIKKRIISPTFIIVRSYALKNQKSKIKSQNDNSKFKSLEPEMFYHVDLYRLNNEKDVEGLGLEEIIGNPENIVAIEWAEKMGSLLPKERIDIRFEYVDEKKRKISIWRKI